MHTLTNAPVNFEPWYFWNRTLFITLKYEKCWIVSTVPEAKHIFTEYNEIKVSINEIYYCVGNLKIFEK